jgi:trans-aconitate methyltransferase
MDAGDRTNQETESRSPYARTERNKTIPREPVRASYWGGLSFGYFSLTTQKSFVHGCIYAAIAWMRKSSGHAIKRNQIYNITSTLNSNFKLKMQRIPEPELMTDEEQAIAYANADFEEPHNHFIELLKESVGNTLPESGTAMDLGCGAADISIRFAKIYPIYKIDALDGSAAMLAEGVKAINAAGLTQDINLIQAYLQETTLANQEYTLIFSNSLLHHLHDPMLLWNAISNAKGNPSIFIMDLMRPENDEKVDALVDEYARGEPEILRRDFRNSLKAAFTPDEVVLQLRTAELEGLQVNVVSDRHLTICSR